METENNQRWKIASILRNWKGSDAGEEASPNEVAEEIDRVYASYVLALPKQTLAIREGQKDWERRVA
jgi:hypothetical protein